MDLGQGALFTGGRGVKATITKETWQKTRDLVLELGILVYISKLPHKMLEKIPSFLLYVPQIFLTSSDCTLLLLGDREEGIMKCGQNPVRRKGVKLADAGVGVGA